MKPLNNRHYLLRLMKEIISFKYKDLLFFILFFLYSSCAYSASTVEIIAKQRIIIAQDRGIITLPFNVINRSSTTQQFSESVDLPDGWRVIASSGFFTLAKGESTLRLVHVLAPSDSSAGKYRIPYQAISKNDLTVRASQEVSVVIKSSPKLSVAIVEKPDLVLAGEQYITTVSVRNNGNVPLSLAAKVKGADHYTVSFEPKVLALAPNKESVIRITTKTPPLETAQFHTLRLSLSGDNILADKTIKTRVVALTPKGTGHYHTIPSKITTSYASNTDTNRLQTEFHAKGLLDTNGEHYIDLLYRDNKTNSISSFGSDSEKHLSYDSDAISARLGDYSFSFSGISSDSFYGEGAEFDYHPIGQKWRFRALTARQHEDSGEGSYISGFEVGYQFSKNLDLAVNTLRLDDSDYASEKNITGIDVHWDKYDAAQFRLSLASDHSDMAYRLRQEGTLGRVNYDLEFQRADTEFGGSINDIKSENLSTSYSFNENKNYLRLNLYHARNNLANDAATRISDENTLRIGVGHYFSNPLRDSLYTELYVRNREDLRAASDYDRVETGLKVRYRKSIQKNLRVSTTLGYVQTDDEITNQLSKDLRGSLSLAFNPNEKYQFGANLYTTNSSDSLDFDTVNSLRYGLNAALNLSPKQRLTGYWSHEDSYDSDSIRLTYDYTFNNGATFGASISNNQFNFNDKELSYLLAFSIPFDTPLYRYNNIGSLDGKVIDKVTERPVSNAIVEFAGQYAVTDQTGAYRFNAVREGEYSITTNLSKTKLDNYIAEDTLQQRITLSANNTTTHTIKLFQGAGISGRVQAYKVSSGSLVFDSKADDLVASGGIPNLLVTLVSRESDDKLYKVLTSEGGVF